jgi:hypothetical protein
MAKLKNDHLELFRVKVEMVINQWVEKMKVWIAENRVMGMTMEGIKKIKETEGSVWEAEKEALNKAIKLEAGGLINRIYQSSYIKEI